MSNPHLARMANLGLCSLLTFFFTISQVHGQMSTDPKLCGGYQRDARGHIDFKFDDNTAPPGIATGRKFCMWTISPTVPQENFRFNMTIRNVNLNCDKDVIAINYFNETRTNFTHLEPSEPGSSAANPFCIDSHEVWERKNQHGTVMVVILYVEEIVMGKGFYLEWERHESWIPGPPRLRNTYYSFGRPSIDPIPYFAASFFRKQISTFGFIKANYTQGYTMEMQFPVLQNCEGQGEYKRCFNNTLSLFNVETNGTLSLARSYWEDGTTDWGPFSNPNGFFIMMQIEDKDYAGGRFTMIYDTVRG